MIVADGTDEAYEAFVGLFAQPRSARRPVMARSSPPDGGVEQLP